MHVKSTDKVIPYELKVDVPPRNCPQIFQRWVFKKKITYVRKAPLYIWREQKTKRDSLCLGNMAWHGYQTWVKMTDAGHLETVCKKTADTRCLGHPKVNSDVLFYVAIAGRKPLLYKRACLCFTFWLCQTAWIGLCMPSCSACASLHVYLCPPECGECVLMGVCAPASVCLPRSLCASQ